NSILKVLFLFVLFLKSKSDRSFELPPIILHLLEEDYLSLVKKYQNSSTKMFEIQTQRRSHKGYQYVYNYVNDIVRKFHVPITKIKINHCDGNWNMPNEVIYRENHPYKYGYGKLMHSGYHFLDLLTYFLEINKENGFGYDKKEIMISDYRPDDFFTYFGKEFNEKLGFKENDEIYNNIDLFKNFGELDISSLVTFKDKSDKIITTAILDLSQSGFSRRSWFELPKDTYKGNGRVRHESFEITVGPLLNIKILSFQSTEISKNPKFGEDAGDLEHFEIQIYNNSDITKNKPYEKLYLSELEDTGTHNVQYIGQNEQARMTALDDFFYTGVSHSNILSHKETISIMKEMELLLSRRYHPSNFRFSVEALIEFNGKYLLCKRSSTAKVAPGIWNIPAGKVQYIEGLEEAIFREVKEETNLEIVNPEYLSYHFINNKDQRIVYTYYAKVENIDDLIVDDTEFDDFSWVDAEQVEKYETLAYYIKNEIKNISKRKQEINENIGTSTSESGEKS
ncbi:NUDIX hydrolase, partial [Lactovum miscens]